MYEAPSFTPNSPLNLIPLFCSGLRSLHYSNIYHQRANYRLHDLLQRNNMHYELRMKLQPLIHFPDIATQGVEAKTYGLVHGKTRTYFRNYRRPIKGGLTFFDATYAALPDEFPPIFERKVNK